MKRKLLPLAVVTAVLSLSTGCSDVQKPKPIKKPTKIVKQKEKSDQRLTISMQSIKTVKKDGSIKADYRLSLDNLSKKNAKIKVRNEGEKLLTINSIKVDNQSKMFIVKDNCKVPLKMNQFCTVDVAFIGSGDATYKSMITINSNDPGSPKTNIEVTGIAKNKYNGLLSVKKGESKKGLQGLELKFDSLNNKNTVVVKNSGLETLTLNKIILSGTDSASFKYTTDCKKSLRVGDSCEVIVSYDKLQKENFSRAQLQILSNGIIAPSDKINLLGYSKPYMISITKYIVSKNVKDFLSDYFTSKKTYYVRTIFQTNIDTALEKQVSQSIDKALQKSGYTIAPSASIADSVITVYPTIETSTSADNTMLFNVKFNGSITTKAKADSSIKSKDNLVTYNQELTASNTTFGAISTLNKFVDKETFEFVIQVNVDNVSNKYEVYESVSDIVASKLINIIGAK